MSDTVISIEGLGKEYVIGGREKDSTSFREMLVSAAAAPFRRLRRLSGTAEEEERIWALKDVSFTVHEGEIVGVIGRNGAGKSTLLKILSRITQPTEGRVEIRGRASSLLEVGTGFHPELTGRENVYLNGAILGMSRVEIDRKFDEITEFSGVAKFLDTPVKRYSSGMSVRLAFAVAAHLEPEILIVDEVLAVGDAEFQRKCLGKMDDVARSGRTVLFVSHNMAAVEGLCTSAILLEDGMLATQGPVRAVLNKYLSNTNTESGTLNGPLSKNGIIESLTIVGTISGTSRVGVGEPVLFRIVLAAREDVKPVRAVISVHDSMGMKVFVLESSVQQTEALTLDNQLSLESLVEELRIYPGTYTVSAHIRHHSKVIDRTVQNTTFDVVERDIYGTGKFLPRGGGIYLPQVKWTITQAQ